MTRAQKILNMWVAQNIKDVTIEQTSADVASLKNRQGELIMTITTNIYGDIMDMNHNILAVSDLPHDVSAVGEQMPHSWTNLEKINESWIS